MALLRHLLSSVATSTALSLLLFSSCGVTKGDLSRESAYAKVYTESPRAILLMPPINETNQVELKENFYATLLTPLSERGYYVFSPFLTQELLQQEGVNNAEELLEANLAPFQRIFGADAALFTVIHRWEKQALNARILFDISYHLRSLKTGDSLFDRRVSGELDTSSYNSSGGLWGGLAQLVTDMLVTALTDKVVAARLANREILVDLPAGPYHPHYRQDQKTLVDSPTKSGVRLLRR